MAGKVDFNKIWTPRQNEPKGFLSDFTTVLPTDIDDTTAVITAAAAVIAAAAANAAAAVIAAAATAGYRGNNT